MTTHEINRLIERYLDGATTPDEERELTLAVQREDAPPEWAVIAEMLGELTADAALYDAIMAQRTPKPAERSVATAEPQSAATAQRFVKLWPWAAAACVALACGLSFHYLRHNAPQEMAHAARPLLPKEAPQKSATPPAEAPLATDASTEAPLVATVTPEAPPLPEHPLEATDALITDATDASTEAHLVATVTTEEPLLPEHPIEATDAPITDANLYLALLAEVEARAFQVELSEQLLYQAILDELLANIQQQSNRPELSL